MTDGADVEPGESGDGSRPVLAAKIDRLVRAVGNPSYQALATEISASGGRSVSAAYLWQLRSGSRVNPTLQHMEALAHYFSTELDVTIPLDYFSSQTPVDAPWSARGVEGDPREAADEAELAARLDEAGIQRIAARYGEIGSSVLRDVLEVMERLTRDGMPSEPRSTPDDRGARRPIPERARPE